MEILTEESINPAFKRIKYEIRGWLEDRTHEIRQELARVSNDDQEDGKTSQGLYCVFKDLEDPQRCPQRSQRFLCHNDGYM